MTTVAPPPSAQKGPPSKRDSNLSAYSTNTECETDAEERSSRRRLTAFEKLSYDLSNDQKCIKELTLGKRIGFYRIRGELGTGNFSQVKMGLHSLTKEKVAIKILDKTKLDQKTQRLLSREISSMERLHHPNIIRLYEVVETLAKLHIVMEYANGGELFGKISNEGKLSETEAKVVFAQVASAVEHMHENHIIHRDLKAENVFYAAPNFVKVGDFGFSTFSRPDNTLNTFCGSPPYAAPELFKDESYVGIYVDIWAMGIMLYFMVTGIMPFRADTVGKLKRCILEGTYMIPSFVSESCQTLISGLLKQPPRDRLTSAEIRKCDWLEGQDFPEALEPYELNPTFDVVRLKDEEKEARKVLHDLGINEEMFKKSEEKQSRSSITGTYRIILHKIHKRTSNESEDQSLENGNSRSTGKENRYASQKKQSKLCTIL